MTIESLSEFSLATVALMMVLVGVLMLMAAWRDDRGRMIKYPPATMVSFGVPIFISGIIAVARIAGEWFPQQGHIHPGTAGFDLLMIVCAVAWVNLVILLANGKLIPPHTKRGK